MSLGIERQDNDKEVVLVSRSSFSYQKDYIKTHSTVNVYTKRYGTPTYKPVRL